MIPCLDVRGGRVVKGTQFESIRDAGDPVSLASAYSDGGADELVFLDITASSERRAAVVGLVSEVARGIDIPFTVGGGVSDVSHARDILLHGADKVGVNTGAVERPALVSELAALFGRQCVVVAIDARRSTAAPPEGAETFGRSWFEVMTYGGRRATRTDAVGWARRAAELGAGEILLTSVDRDGTGDGYDVELTRAVAGAVGVPVIASGGCGSAAHMAEALAAGADAALAASIFHYEARGVEAVKRELRALGVRVRL